MGFEVMTTSISVNIHVHARCELLEATLSQRQFAPKRGIYTGFFHLFFLTSGKAQLSVANQLIEMQPSAIAYIPVTDDFSISMGAGSAGYLLGASNDLLIEALGSGAESVLLREFSEREIYAHDAQQSFIEELYNLSDGLMNEIYDPERGSRMAVGAYFRLMLMGLWRLTGSRESQERGYGESTTVLQSFRQLVEVHYRQRWPVSRYAQALRLSHDRLHAICTRTLSKTPSQLIQERAIFEAKLRLERSGNSIQQLAHDLGFTDSTTFSHYFKRYSGVTPAAFRKMSKKPQAEQQQNLSFGYADWP
ncbi:MAG: helix-turn-helix domain-containing protein [Oceanospirillaceae bacterium]|nr:helix-turn-helix domain-containing protein [Oceanospirillaceae bacterium]